MTEFLELSSEEIAFIEVKRALASQLGSSQSRVAKMEAGDRLVSLDLLVRSMLTASAGPTEISSWIKRAARFREARLNRLEPRLAGQPA